MSTDNRRLTEKNTEEPFIRAQNLRYDYIDDVTGEKVEVLRGVDLTVYKGEYIAIIGHNGSGKSTLAKLFNLVLEPVAGTILIDGVNVSDPELSEDALFHLRQQVGMVFQNPDNQLVATIVEEDVAFGPENLGLPPAEIRRRVDEALEEVGMLSYAGHEPQNLSGGQKQRVAIAGILAMMPTCMIFDESTAMLDPAGRKEVLETMEMLNRERGITIITITHHMEEAARADRIIVLDDGVIRLDGTPEAVFSQPEILTDAGLETPQSAMVIHELHAKGFGMPGRLGNLGDCTETLFAAWEAKRIAGNSDGEAEDGKD